MRSAATLLLLAALLSAPAGPALSYTLQLNASAAVQFRWPTRTIPFALSTSLNNPPPNVRATGEEVVAAARRALARWAEAADVEFVITTSSLQAVSPVGSPDGVNLITVSQTPGIAFNDPNQTGGVRVFTDGAGNITEADIAVNPGAPFSTDGSFVPFASDSTFEGSGDTFDLESTFLHEIGHALGLEHSGIVGSVMQPRQARNGTYGLPALQRRSLASDDRAGARAIYGPAAGLGELRGTIRNAGGGPVFGAHVWAEEISTGRAVAGNVTLQNGSYQIRALPPGDYRLVVEPLNGPVFASQVASRTRPGGSPGAYAGLQDGQAVQRTSDGSTATVVADSVTNFDVSLEGLQAILNPAFVGTRDDLGSSLSQVSLPVAPGSTVNVLVGGENVHTVEADGVQINSPYFTINRASFLKLNFGNVQVLSFDVSVSALAAPGDYSVRLAAAASGEVAYLSGALTVEPPNAVPAGTNLLDGTAFFVAQHYRDFLSREPDPAGLAFWSNEVEGCGSNLQCREVKRINVSAAFFLSIEFQETGYFVYRVYQAAFGDLPGRPVPVRAQQFFPAAQQIGRGVVVGVGDWQARLEANKRQFLLGLVGSAEFLARHPPTESPAQFVDSLNANAGGVLSQAERDQLVAELSANNTAAGRADVLRRVADDEDLVRQEFNEAFVLMQYFGYLRRNPDDFPDSDFAGFNFWLAKLEQFGGNFLAAEMVKAFLESVEYRERFGQ
ncbi:MAG TPA: matrixin family metalloprotease [Pyrinomonadaceae bacterium]|nr:matrixin family metalloprotease [Pyrinomonadaceae bacterium]